MPVPYTLIKIKNAIEESANTAIKKSEQMIEISKINLEIADKEKEIQDLYIKIGEKVYKHKTINSSIEKYCKEIKAIEVEILELKSEILKIQNKRICPLCRHEVKKHSTYCEYCGLKL